MFIPAWDFFLLFLGNQFRSYEISVHSKRFQNQFPLLL